MKAKYYHDELHYAGLVASHIMILKDGGYLATIAYQPKDYQNTTNEEIEYGIGQIQSAVESLEEGWTIQFDYHRRETDPRRKNVFTHPVLREFEEENNKKRAVYKHYNSMFFINIFFLLPPKRGDLISKLFYKNYTESNATEEYLERFKGKLKDILYQITPAFDYAMYLEDSDFLSYIHSCTSLKYHPVRVPEIPFYLDAVLDDVTINTEYPVKVDEQYMEVLRINDYPNYSRIAMLDALQSLDFSFRLSQRFIAFDKTKASAEVRKYRSKWFAKRKSMMASVKENQGTEILEDTEQLSKVALADDALERMGMDEFTFGLYTSKLIVYDASYKGLQKKVEILMRIISQNGFTAKKETFNAFDGWIGTHPGNVYSDVCRPMMQTRSVAELVQSNFVWQGKKENEHLEEVYEDLRKRGEVSASIEYGEYHVQCTTSGSSTFRLNLNVQDVGHTFIAGPTGSGKSILLGTLAMQWFRYPKGRVIIFDKDRSAYGLSKSLGGLTYVPGAEDSHLRFQPFRDIDTKEGFLFALDFVKTILELNDVSYSVEEVERISLALERFKQYSKETRTVSNFIELLHSSKEHKITLGLYSDEKKGQWGFLFDGNSEEIGEADLRLFEMAEIMKYKEDVVLPTLLYLFYVVEKSMGKYPTLMILDEAWLFLQHSVFAKKIEEWLKVLRKKHVYVVFATQELSDASKSGIADTIQGNCKTKIFLPNPMAITNPEVYRQFGMTDKDIEIIASGRPKHDYFYASELGKRLFSLDLTEKQLDILKGRGK